MYKLSFSKTFDKNFSALTKRNKPLKKQIEQTLALMIENLSHPSLRIHKAETKNYGRRWSVSVDEKIRIIWDFDAGDSNLIVLLDIGSHKVYR